MTRSRRRHHRLQGLNGIFAADVQVFRFYGDGTVLDVCVRPAPGPEQAEAIARWLRRENPLPGVHVVRYELREQRIAFVTRSHLTDEDVTVRGTWAHGRLRLGSTGQGWEIKPRDFVRLDVPRGPKSARE